jgi:hypothetical protein
MKKQITFIMALLLSFGLTYWWYSGHSANGAAAHSLAQLSNNAENKNLRLRLNPKPDFTKTCGQFSKLKLEEIKYWLNQPDRELNEVSFALHYLGNRYLAADSFDTGRRYLQISAEQYLNPFSYLKLAQIYTTPRAEVEKKFPKQVVHFEQDIKAAYLYLRLAQALSETSMHKQGDNYLFNFVNKYIDGAMLNLQEQQKTLNLEFSSEKERVDSTVEATLKAYNRMYSTEPT